MMTEKISISQQMREVPKGEHFEKCGPFLTISRQFGCYGFSLGLLLLEILNEDAEASKTWKIYHKEILEKLAAESSVTAELLEEQRKSKPHLITDFFRALGHEHVPGGYEIRNRITAIIRDLAVKGHAIIIGQGGSGATADMPNGLSIRLEAPHEWRVKQVAFREGTDEIHADILMHQKDKEREELRQIYNRKFPRTPPFHLVYDCSIFSLAQIAQHIVYAMRLRHMI